MPDIRNPKYNPLPIRLNRAISRTEFLWGLASITVQLICPAGNIDLATDPRRFWGHNHLTFYWAILVQSSLLGHRSTRQHVRKIPPGVSHNPPCYILLIQSQLLVVTKAKDLYQINSWLPCRSSTGMKNLEWQLAVECLHTQELWILFLMETFSTMRSQYFSSSMASESMFGQLIGNGRVLASCLLAAGVRGTKVSDGASNIHTKS